ncbi:triose-phosphate isomerase [Candidatus Erwinia haradaeae]|uniref:Triosephosphate isomerase n=1 Tax=Candidatus Erwinia haradaeae TaxID=1922217 RepID=A0A803FTR4_9GAMM|nr:triose-phosphate isomerase [Candidatus Erwinia haradaeae]VFP88244.1 Triosephosphate isomerase [Candidatus Erwinia haradaeae]
MRYPFIMGNWKLNGNRDTVNQLIFGLRQQLNGIVDCVAAIAPPVIYLEQAKRALYDSPIALAAQNVDVHLSGAFTGDISAYMLKDIGTQYVIIGHSERRIWHKETDEIIATKFSVLKKIGLIPILCIGETAQEKLKGKTKEICTRQIDAILCSQGVDAFYNAVIAYEPVWAIGTGIPEAPQQVQRLHKFIRDYIMQKNKIIADQLIIQYGGSVTSQNAEELFSQPDIDGALVGGASLRSEEFAEIIKIAIQKKS